MKTSDEYKLATIVLAEDNLADIHYIIAILKHNQVIFNLCTCRDGQELLDLLRKRDAITAQRPDLILLDLNLPKINGFQILKVLQNDSALKTLPIGILSGSQFKEDIKHCYQLGARFFMPKPFKINKFLTIIRDINNLNILKKEDSVFICQV